MKFKALICVLTTVFLTCASGLALAKKENLPEITEDGLHLVKDTKLALVYAEPGADLSQYKRIYMTDAYIAFKKHWQRSQNRQSSNRVSTNQMDKIKVEVAELFKEVMTETLEEGGYELVTEVADDVLIIKPAIINLNITAPENRSAGMTRTFSESAGDMTLYLELYDSVTGDLIAKALDQQYDRQTGYIQWQNRVTNTAAARRIMRHWAKVMKDGLDEATSVNGQ
jgi:hypothetical protein